MDALSTQYRRLSEIRLWEGNPKRHDVDRLVASIRRYGFTSPLIVNEATGLLMVGHGRHSALLRMKERGEAPPERIRVKDGDWLVPVITGVSLEELEAISYALDDNLSTMAGGDLSFVEVSRAFNQEKLATIMEELAEKSALPVFGKEEEYGALLDSMLEVQGLTIEEDFDVEAALAAAIEPRVKRGQLWELGRHRLLCGDSANPDDLARLMGGELAKLVACDPPFGVSLDPSRWRRAGSGRIPYGPIVNDDLQGEELLAFLSAAFTIAARHTAEDASWYVWCASTTRPTFLQALAAAGVRVHQEIIWAKPSFQLGYADYHWQHETCLYGWGKRHHFYGERNQSTLWRIDRDRERMHPAGKPVELFMRPIRNNLRRGELALDMFLGSGTAIIAAEELGRRCFGLEIDPAHCQAAIARWERLTRQKAKLRSGQ